jgi:hypothetical protein
MTLAEEDGRVFPLHIHKFCRYGFCTSELLIQLVLHMVLSLSVDCCVYRPATCFWFIHSRYMEFIFQPVTFPAGAGNFSLHHRVQNGSGAHPTFYPVGTRGHFLGGKAAGA